MIYHFTLFICYLLCGIQYNHALSLSLRSRLSQSLKIYGCNELEAKISAKASMVDARKDMASEI